MLLATLTDTPMYSGSPFFLLIEVVLFTILFVKVSNLRKDLDIMKNAKSSTKKASGKASTALTSHKQAPQQAAHEPTLFDQLVTWTKEDFLMKLGAVLVLLAIAWFVRYAFLNDWIGPVGRIALGMLTGAGIFVGGYATMKKRRIPGQVLLVLGATTLLLTIFAAREYYDFFTPGSALGMMSLVIIVSSIISVREDAFTLAVASFSGGLVAPLLTASPSPNFLVLTSYLFLLSLGAFSIISMKKWRPLAALAILGVGIYIGPAELLSELEDQLAWLFAGLFYALFFLGNAAAIWREKNVILSDIFSILVTLWLGIFWTNLYVPNTAQSLVMLIVAIMALLVAVAFHFKSLPKGSVYLQGIGAMLFFGAAILFEFKGDLQTIAFGVEALVFLALAIYLLKDKKASVATWALHMLPGLLVVENLQHAWKAPLFQLDFFVPLTVGLIFGGSAYMLHAFSQRMKKDADLGHTALILAAASLSIGAAILWRGLEVYLPADYAHGTSLVIYTLFGLGFFFKGVVNQTLTMKWAGHIILALVLLRLLFVEIWAMSLVERILTFVVIGVLFILTAFFEKKSK